LVFFLLVSLDASFLNTISIPKSHPMRELLTVAKENGNVLSLSQTIIGTNLSPEEAQKLLIDAVKKELAHVDNDPITGVVRYYFDI
jgi:hypothetical protein